MKTIPNQWKFCLKKTPTGPILLTFTEKGLAGLEFSDCRHLSTILPDKLKPLVQQVSRALEAYFADGAADLGRIPVDLQGTPFQLRVWQALRHIAPGHPVSYQELAQRLGKPRAARAVGQACGANPIPLVVPCHRVIAANGSLGGFSSGLERKKWLLEHESVGEGQGPEVPALPHSPSQPA